MKRKHLSGTPLGDKNFGYFGTYNEKGECVAVNIYPLALKKEMGIE